MDNGGGERGNYIIPTETNLKQYYIEEESYDGVFGTGKLIAQIEGTSGNDRFYLMNLNDFDSNTYIWYDAGGMIENQEDYFVSPEANDFALSDEEPRGKVNTERMITFWNENSSKTENCIWKVIQKKGEDGMSLIEKGWFVPSKSEFAAFGKTLDIENRHTNFKQARYWSSSIYDMYNAYLARLDKGDIDLRTLDNDYGVLLSTTF